MSYLICFDSQRESLKIWWALPSLLLLLSVPQFLPIAYMICFIYDMLWYMICFDSQRESLKIDCHIWHVYMHAGSNVILRLSYLICFEYVIVKESLPKHDRESLFSHYHSLSGIFWMCERERDRTSESVCERECLFVCVCVCVRVCVLLRGVCFRTSLFPGFSLYVCVCVSEWMGETEREGVCVCVCSYSMRASECHSLPGILCMCVSRYEYESGR